MVVADKDRLDNPLGNRNKDPRISGNSKLERTVRERPPSRQEDKDNGRPEDPLRHTDSGHVVQVIREEGKVEVPQSIAGHIAGG